MVSIQPLRLSYSLTHIHTRASARSHKHNITNPHTHTHPPTQSAGVMAPPLSYTKQGFEMQIGTNHFGHHYLTKLLLPKMEAQEPAKAADRARIVVSLASGVSVFVLVDNTAVVQGSESGSGFGLMSGSGFGMVSASALGSGPNFTQTLTLGLVLDRSYFWTPERGRSAF